MNNLCGNQMVKLNYAVVVSAIVWIALHTAGCGTIVGVTLGAIADAREADYDTLHNWQADKLSSGDSVSVICDSCAGVKGVYLGTGETPPDKYLNAYAAWQVIESTAVLFPSLGDTIVIHRPSPLQGNVRGILLGFDTGAILIQAESDTDRISVGDVSTLSYGCGKAVPGDTLRKQLGRGGVPIMSVLLLEVGTETVRLPLYEVREIRKANSRQHKLTGLVLGASFDALLILGFSASLSGLNLGGTR